MIEFVQTYWGLIVALVALVGYFIHDFDKAKLKIASKIFEAEERARELMLTTGKAKFTWVKHNTYHLLPKWLKFILSEDMYQALIQRVFNELKEWAKNRPLPK